MKIKRLFLIGSVSAALAGCSEFYASQPPAPVYGGESPIYVETTPVLPKPKVPPVITPAPIGQSPAETVKTKPLKEFVPITATEEALEPEPLTSEQGQEASAPGEGAAKSGQAPSAPTPEAAQPQPGAATTPPSQASATPKPNQESVDIAAKPAFVAPPPPPFEPLETFAPLSPAVGALALAANQNSNAGDVGSATTTIERAIRIEPRNATLYYKLALLKLKQSKPRLAEDLAKKAALLASNDTQLKKHSWLLVARAREVQGDLKGGKEARAKAKKF